MVWNLQEPIEDANCPSRCQWMREEWCGAPQVWGFFGRCFCLLDPLGSCTTFIPYMGMKYVHTLSCIICGGNFDLNIFAIFVHVLFVSFFWVLKHCVLMDVHCDVMLFLAGKMCTMKPSLLVRHNETSITDQSAWLKNDFQHPPTCHDIVRGMIRLTNKNMLHQYNQCWIFQRNPILDLSLSLSQSRPTRKTDILDVFIQLEIFCSPTPPTSL